MRHETRLHRIGIVGAGNISKLHLDGIKRHPDKVRPVALCDPNASMLRERCDEYCILEGYASVEEMIEKTSIDAAILCTPTHFRKSVIAPLIDAGIPVLCEKPLAETLSEAREIEAMAANKGVPVAVNQNFRRHFSFQLGKEVLSQGHLGKPMHLAQTTCYLRRDTGWRLDLRRYVMAVMSIHWFDGYRFLLDDEPETVYCRSVNSPATDGGDDTAISLILQFSKGTVVSLDESFSSFTRPFNATLDCEAGGLVMDYGKLVEVRADGDRIEHINPYDKAGATYHVLADLLAAVEEGREPETSVADNIKSIKIMEAAYRSAETGQVIKIKDIA